MSRCMFIYAWTNEYRLQDSVHFAPILTKQRSLTERQQVFNWHIKESKWFNPVRCACLFEMSKDCFFPNHQENHDVLIKCLMEDKRFDKNRPVVACIVHKALLQWRSFEAEKTTIFDRIIHTIRSSIEVVFLCHYRSAHLVTSLQILGKRSHQFNMWTKFTLFCPKASGKHQESSILALDNFNPSVPCTKYTEGKQHNKCRFIS